MQDRCIVICVITVVILAVGFLNPKFMHRDGEVGNCDSPSFVWLAACGFVAGLIACYAIPKGYTIV